MGNQVLEEKIFKIDKSKWKPTKLGTLAEDISVRVDKPGNSEYDRFVGLDNFISGDINIKSWASTKNLTSSAKAFKAGDILFARRNAYLRRASLVDFDGCCSGDAFVIRENKDKVVPGFLAFLMNTNSLWDYANSNAAGTMSKRVKWRDLAEYEFLLPPKSEQARLAELLWALDEVIEKEKEVHLNFAQYKNSLVDELLTGKRRSPGFAKTLNKYSLVEIANFRRGSFPQPYGLPEWYDDENGFPFVQVYDIDYNLKLKSNTKVKISKKATDFSVFVPKGTLIISIQGSIGRVAITQYDAYVDRTILIFTEYLKETNILYFSYVIQKLFYEKEKSARGAVIKTITKEELSKFIIPFPDIKEQEKIATEFDELEKRNIIINNKISASESLQKSLINQIF